jgi:acyl-CoA reductase-like NAD-dependent aldehyde dehydrogenase
MSETRSQAFKLVKFDSYHNIINGELRSTEKTRHGINPATLEPNPEVPVSPQKDVDDAVHSARIAFRAWSKTPFEKRAQAVVDFAAAIESQKEGFIQLLTQEQGKPVRYLVSYVGQSDGKSYADVCDSLPLLEERY